MPTFLDADAPPDRRVRALTANVRRWIVRSARGANGEVHRKNGVTWVYAPAPGGEDEIAFPRLSASNADAQLDAIVEFYRQRQPSRAVICWSTEPTAPEDLARLVLDGKPDLQIEDGVFHSTPLGWARHFQRTELIEIIERKE
ncbi:MAG TPA: hypothetical protein VNL16_14680 [Chloroflexota bacterium]|nr:hypothetical protein [Chloroflexota bacterium]